MNKPVMKVIIVGSYLEMGERAAKLVQQLLHDKPNAVLGLATGSTPESTYAELVRMSQEKQIDFSHTVTFNLDEYYPIARSNSQSYWDFMHDKLFRHINVNPQHIHVLHGEAQDPVAECASYEEAIGKAGGIDLQILGIGNNGHIAFNEPGSPLTSRTRVVQLDESTIQANSRYFSSAEDVPKQALSMGMGTIMEARHVILLASGAKKADAIRQSLEGPVTEAIPASILQQHPNCTFILDREAASLLKNTYEQV